MEKLTRLDESLAATILGGHAGLRVASSSSGEVVREGEEGLAAGYGPKSYLYPTEEQQLLAELIVILSFY
jgi:hypothetical protein